MEPRVGCTYSALNMDRTEKVLGLALAVLIVMGSVYVGASVGVLWGEYSLRLSSIPNVAPPALTSDSTGEDIADFSGVIILYTMGYGAVIGLLVGVCLSVIFWRWLKKSAQSDD